jgi:hypothetical protein
VCQSLERRADLAKFHAHGWAGEKSPEREKTALRKACELGHKENRASPENTKS